MRTVPKAAVLGLIIATSWLSSFWLTRSQAIARWQEDNPVWLGDVSDDIIQNEKAFCQWVEETKQTLKQQRFELSQLMEDPTSQDDAIFSQSDLIAQTHAELLRGIGQHLKSMRSSLPDSQKELLTGFCFQSMQGGMQRMRHRYQMDNDLQQGDTDLPWSGNGFGWRRRQGCCGLTRRLQLIDEQIEIAKQKDPDFENDVRLLQNKLLSERQELLLLLEDQQALNGQIPQQIEHLIAAHKQLGRRLIDHVVIMRPYFTVEQQKRLIRMCKNSNSET